MTLLRPGNEGLGGQSSILSTPLLPTFRAAVAPKVLVGSPPEGTVTHDQAHDCYRRLHAREAGLLEAKVTRTVTCLRPSDHLLQGRSGCQHDPCGAALWAA